jgi:hypothetical protein
VVDKEIGLFIDGRRSRGLSETQAASLRALTEHSRERVFETEVKLYDHSYEHGGWTDIRPTST